MNNAGLQHYVKQYIEEYFAHLDGEKPQGVYDLLLSQIMPPALEAAMQHCKGNKTQAAKVLGLNRITLRKFINLYLAS